MKKYDRESIDSGKIDKLLEFPELSHRFKNSNLSDEELIDLLNFLKLLAGYQVDSVLNKFKGRSK